LLINMCIRFNNNNGTVTDGDPLGS